MSLWRYEKDARVRAVSNLFKQGYFLRFGMFDASELPAIAVKGEGLALFDNYPMNSTARDILKETEIYRPTQRQSGQDYCWQTQTLALFSLILTSWLNSAISMQQGSNINDL